MLRNLFFFFITLISIKAGAQKFPFYNYGVDKGLIQSQVISLTQDKEHHLWIGTLSGIDRFDGTNFKHFTKKDGFSSAIPTCLFTAADGKIWAGTLMGIISYDGAKFMNYPLKLQSENSFFRNFIQDKSGVLYALSLTDGLFYFDENKFIKIELPKEGIIPTCAFQNANGQVYVLFNNGDFFKLSNKKWELSLNIQGLNADEFVLSAIEIKGYNYFLSNTGHLLKVSNSKVITRQKINAEAITGISSDNFGSIWAGTRKGVQLYSSQDLALTAQYDAASGLSDNTVTQIYLDAENNIWIATDGDGLFRYSNGAFAKYTKTDGLNGYSVMGFAKDIHSDLYVGTREGGLAKFSKTIKKFVPLQYPGNYNVGILCSWNDPYGNIYISTVDNRILKYNGNEFTEIIVDSRFKPGVNTIAGTNNTMWFASTIGCYYMQKDLAAKVPGLDKTTIGLLPLDDSSVLIGGNKGAYEYKIGGRLKEISFLQNTEILCFYKYKQYILIGTIDEGLLFWNKNTSKIDTCDVTDGLSDNMIFSIYNDSKNNLWVGSGTGLQQVVYNETTNKFSVKRFTEAEGYERVENGMGCIIEDIEGQIWIGTTKGAFRYQPDIRSSTQTAPYVVIKTVYAENMQKDLLIKGSSLWNNLPASPVISYNKSEISFTVKGIDFKDPNSINYSYQLVGADTGFSPTTNQSSVSYKSLEPGKYTFRVKAYNGHGIASSNIAEYEFTVSTPFYKTTWFSIAVILFLVSFGFLLQMLFAKAKQNRKKQQELLRLKEQENIRLRTSEDFHDELGNKLTRISLLADILEKKIEVNEPGKEKIIHQIKENVIALYSGTKDIIWSLSPGSDSLLEILKRIQHFGNELFNESNINFSFSGIQGIDKDVNLPMDYSRNLIMIYKELLNNALRHSSATKVHLHVSMSSINEIIITLDDDGKGFEPEQVNKGNGLNNINSRADRIKASIQVHSEKGTGSTTILKLIIPPNGGYNK